MPAVQTQVDTSATQALCHFFSGLMKTDGIITQKELSKVEILVRKFRNGLPSTPDDILAQLKLTLSNPDYSRWMAGEHLDAAFTAFDRFVASGMASHTHLATILDLVEILAEVDGLSESEVFYLNRMHDEFDKRYADK